jgi:hypothetical protein
VKTISSQYHQVLSPWKNNAYLPMSLYFSLPFYF